MKRIIAFLAVLVILFSTFSCSVAALSSSMPKEFYSITIEVKGNGIAETDKWRVDTSGEDIVKLLASNDDFIRWELNGTYDVAEGSLESNTIKIIPYSDIDAIAYFKGYENWKIVTEKKPTSPNTGQDTFPYYIVIIAGGVAIFGVVYSIHKIKQIKIYNKI